MTPLYATTTPEPVDTYTFVYNTHSVHMYCQNKVSILLLLVLIASYSVRSSTGCCSKKVDIGTISVDLLSLFEKKCMCERVYSARNYRPCFRENQPKRSFSI